MDSKQPGLTITGNGMNSVLRAAGACAIGGAVLWGGIRGGAARLRGRPCRGNPSPRRAGDARPFSSSGGDPGGADRAGTEGRRATDRGRGAAVGNSLETARRLARRGRSRGRGRVVFAPKGLPAHSPGTSRIGAGLDPPRAIASAPTTRARPCWSRAMTPAACSSASAGCSAN